MKPSNKDSMKNSVNDYLNSFSLSDEQIAQFNNLENIAENTVQHKKSGIIKRYQTIAASMVLALALPLIVAVVFYYQSAQHSNLVYEIAHEVSYNHLKLRPLEISANNTATVINYFEQLDFNPVSSTLTTSLNSSIIGGRYCSIKGNTAAQLRMQDKQGQYTTLFQTQYNAEDFSTLPVLENNQQPIIINANGKTVELWVEKGVVMALVY